MNLDEACLFRSNELSRILAGLVAIEPVTTLSMLEGLKPTIFTDIQARMFINGMKERFTELQASSPDEQIKIGIEVAKSLGVLSTNYLNWLIDIYDKNTGETIKELKRLSITLSTIADLQGWIKASEERFA